MPIDFPNSFIPHDDDHWTLSNGKEDFTWPRRSRPEEYREYRALIPIYREVYHRVLRYKPTPYAFQHADQIGYMIHKHKTRPRCLNVSRVDDVQLVNLPKVVLMPAIFASPNSNANQQSQRGTTSIDEPSTSQLPESMDTSMVTLTNELLTFNQATQTDATPKTRDTDDLSASKLPESMDTSVVTVTHELSNFKQATQTDSTPKTPYADEPSTSKPLELMDTSSPKPVNTQSMKRRRFFSRNKSVQQKPIKKRANQQTQSLKVSFTNLIS